MKALVLIAMIVGATQFAAAQDAAPPPANAGELAPSWPFPAAQPARSRPPHAALPAGIPEQFSPPQQAYASSRSRQPLLRHPVEIRLRDDVAPAVLKLGAPLRGLDNFDSYESRIRNRVRGATLSEHDRANALDV